MSIQLSKPASNEEMAEALKFLFASLPLPSGTDPERAIFGYFTALDGMSLSVIENGIRKVLRGECKDVSRKFCPRPPELADICRGSSYAVTPAANKPNGKYYAYSQPESKILEHNVTKEWAFRLVDQGVHPRGSIWCPGAINDKPEIGDLFGPDPEWKRPKPLSEFKQ